MSLPSPSGATPSASTGRVGRPVIVSPEAAQDIRVALEGAAMLGAPVAEALERDLDAALEDLAGSELAGGAAIARRRIGASTWAVLYVVEPRRVVVVALVRSRTRSM